jgi:hypothetical protein
MVTALGFTQEAFGVSAAPLATASRTQPSSTQHLLGIAVSMNSIEQQPQQQAHDFWYQHPQLEGEQEVEQIMPTNTEQLPQELQHEHEQQPLLLQEQLEQPHEMPEEAIQADPALLTLHCMASIRSGVDRVQAVAHAMQNRTTSPWHAAADLLQVCCKALGELPGMPRLTPWAAVIVMHECMLRTFCHVSFCC